MPLCPRPPGIARQWETAGGGNEVGLISKLFGHGEEPRRGRAVVLVAALALIAALVLSACGGGSSSSSAGESTGASQKSTQAPGETSGGEEEETSEASGEPIPIMALGTFEATVAYPEGPPAFEAQVEKINKEGGVNRSELEVTICNAQSNP